MKEQNRCETCKGEKIIWISVDDRLPDLGERGLIYTEYKTMYSAFHCGNNEWSDNKTEWESSEVTHWKPLPLPPNNKGV